jgi:hypothetical protein
MLSVVGGFRSPGCRRRLRRALGWLSLGALAPALFACNARTVERPNLLPDVTGKGTVSLVVNRNVDLLFLIDDSSSMKLSQDNLRRNFPAFMMKLKNLPGGLPNVHIAIASSDMGAGDGSVDGCAASKNGIFQSAPGVDCTATGLDAGATFISDVNGVRNYTGNLENVFTCMAALGEKGCGFEHQFAAITRALGADGQAPPVENHDFLRPDAYLAIVMITNEDDCSASPGVSLFDYSSNKTIADRLGPLTNFRCNEFGHVCDGIHPDRHAPNDDVNATKTYDNCVSAEDGALLTVADTAARIKALKPNRDDQIVFAAISGASAPYTVHWIPPKNGDTSPWPEISHECTAADGSYADPSPRINQLVRAFGPNGLQLSICNGEFQMALERIADKIADHISKPCITGQVAKKPGTAIDDCTVSSSSPDDTGNVVERPIAACTTTGGAGPCWQLTAGEANCAGQTIAVVPDPSVPPPAWENAAVQCAMCTPGVTDAARGCP